MTITAVTGQEGQVGNTVGSPTQALTFAGNVTAGNIVLVGANRYNVLTVTAFASGDVTKTGGTATIGTPVLVRHTEVSDTSEYQQGIWRVPITGTGSLTLTVGGGVALAFWFVPFGEYASSIGWDSSADESGNSHTDAANGVTPANSGTATSAATALFWGLLGSDGSSTVTINPNTGGGWTEVAEQQSASTHLIGAAQRLIVTTGTTDQASWTLSGTWTFIAALLEVFKEASGGASITGTGALTAGAATSSGAGTRGHVGTGAASAGAATASGTGSVNGAPIAITGTGALTSSKATSSGAGNRGITDNGGPVAITGPVATLSGVGTVSSPGAEITGTGALTSSRATLSGLGVWVPAGGFASGAGRKRDQRRRGVSMRTVAGGRG